MVILVSRSKQELKTFFGKFSYTRIVLSSTAIEAERPVRVEHDA